MKAKTKPKTNGSSLVVKDNKLVSAVCKLTLQEQRLLAFGISRLKRNREGFETDEFPLIEFADFFNLDRQDCYNQIPKALEQLRARVITMHGSDESGEYVCITGWVYSAKYWKGDGKVTIRFSDELAPYLLKLSESFTSYQLKNIVEFKSTFSFNLYELLKQNFKLGKRKFDLDEFKMLLGVTGKYPLFNNLKIRVIEVAVGEINAHSDIQTAWETITRGRKVIGLMFYITRNEANRTDQEKFREKVAKASLKEAQNPEFAERLRRDFGLAKKQAVQVANLWVGHEDKGGKILDRIWKRWQEGEIEKSLGGYVYDVMKREGTALHVEPFQATLPGVKKAR